MVYFSLNSARIFFRADKTAEEEKEEKEKIKEGKYISESLTVRLAEKNRLIDKFSKEFDFITSSSSSSSSLFARKKEKYNTYVIKNKKYQKAYNFPGEEAH